MKNLSRLDITYETASIRQKREMFGSIFPEKLTFDGFDFRTTRLNEVVRLIFALDAGSSDPKKEKTGKNAGLSCSVAPQIEFSNHFLGDLVRLASIEY